MTRRRLLALSLALLCLPVPIGCRTRTVELVAPVAGDVVVAPGAPDGIETVFAGDARDEDAKDGDLSLLYPNHEAVLPRNLAALEVQWKADKELDHFELRVRAGDETLRIYTGAEAHRFGDARWERLVRDHAGSRIELSLRASDGDSEGPVLRSRPLEVQLSASEVPGTVYFWSTGAAGIMRSTLSSRVATKFFPAPASIDARADAGMGTRGPECVGCHTLSRDGRRLAVATGDEGLLQVKTADGSALSTAAQQAFGWGSFDPGATRLIVAHEGGLSVLDADTGAPLSERPAEDGPGLTHPDWSPDGRHVAVALVADKWDDDKKLEGSSLARLSVALDGTLGEPEILVQSEDEDDTLSFPAHSPDGAWIAFTRTDGKSKDAKKSQLWIVAADGSGEPIELARLNFREGLEEGKDMGNSMPTWAPGLGDGRHWLAFSSVRDYGQRRTDDKRDQLWAAAIGSDVVAGEDPSSAAFWLPFQQDEDSNHRAFWALSGDACGSVELCNDADDDCDDRVDESCCTPEPEQCGDGLDNDCDGQRDEACGCAFAELCDNEVDEDCDGRFDEDCLL